MHHAQMFPKAVMNAVETVNVQVYRLTSGFRLGPVNPFTIVGNEDGWAVELFGQTVLDSENCKYPQWDDVRWCTEKLKEALMDDIERLRLVKLKVDRKYVASME
jgi:hypothetical protein